NEVKARKGNSIRIVDNSVVLRQFSGDITDFIVHGRRPSTFIECALAESLSNDRGNGEVDSCLKTRYHIQGHIQKRRNVVVIGKPCTTAASAGKDGAEPRAKERVNPLQADPRPGL